MAQQSRPEGLAIITGAASGMGEASARLMAEAGWPLLLCDVNAERLGNSAKTLGKGDAEVLAGDISAPGFGDDLAAALKGRKVGALVHAAGLSPTMASAERILDVNLAGTMRLTETVLPHMSEGACAVLFASSAAHQMGDKMDEQIGAVTTPEAVATLAPLCQDNSAWPIRWPSAGSISGPSTSPTNSAPRAAASPRSRRGSSPRRWASRNTSSNR